MPAMEMDLALDRGILEALTCVMKQTAAGVHTIAAGHGLTAPDLLALFRLGEVFACPSAGVPADGGVSMKELARRMACDASFITGIADTLESRGLIRREPSAQDRRVKNLVLTPEGAALKERTMAEFTGRMPWSHGLDDTERQAFLTLLHKMLAGAGNAEGTQSA